MMMIW